MHCAFLSTQTESLIYGGEVHVHEAFYHGAYDEEPCDVAWGDDEDMPYAGEAESVHGLQEVAAPLQPEAEELQQQEVEEEPAPQPPGYLH